MKTDNKFTVIYSFKIIEGKENDFINAWTELTKLIYRFCGSYGSRLHTINEQQFIGYAQWPNKETWKHSGGKLPEAANEFRKQMRESCIEIKTVYEMNVLEDLLKEKTYTDNAK